MELNKDGNRNSSTARIKQRQVKKIAQQMELNKDWNRNTAQKLELNKDRGKKLINRWN